MHYLVDQPVAAVVEQQLVVTEKALRVARGAEHPGAQLDLVDAQIEDQVVQFAGKRKRIKVRALGVDRGDAGRRVPARPRDGDPHGGRHAVELRRDVAVTDRIDGPLLREWGEHEAGPVSWPRGPPREIGSTLGYDVVPLLTWHGLVDQPPLHGLPA